MYVDNWETQAKRTLMAINKYLHVCGKLGDSSQNNVNGYQQIFTCIWELGGGGGGTQAKTTLMSLNKYLHVHGNWGRGGRTQANNVNVSQQIFTCTWGLGGLKLKQR